MSGESLPLLTSSRLKDARACQRYHKYRYLDGYVPREDVPTLRYGTLIHRALEAWWLAPVGYRLEAALRVLDPTNPAVAESDAYERAAARAQMIGYDERWHGEALRTLRTEVEFRAPLVNPDTGMASRTWQLAGKLDGVVATADGRVLILEHKTSSEDVSPGSGYWARLRLDGQVSIYYEGARALGYDVEGCLYDVLRKPAMRPLRATPPELRKYTKAGALYANQREADETPDEYFTRVSEAIASDPNGYYQRGTVVRLEAELHESAWDIWVLGRQLREAALADRYPRNVDSCMRFNRPCAYFGVCSGEASLDNEELFTREERVHRELSGAVGA